MDIVCFGQVNWDWCWTGKQHLSVRLARRGHRVLYVDPNWSPAPRSAIKDRLALCSPHFGLRELEHQLYVYTPHKVPSLGYRLNRARRGRDLPRIVKSLQFENPVVLTLNLDAAPWIEKIAPAATVYYAYDELTGFGGMSASEISDVRAREEIMARRADACIAISERLAEKLRRLNSRTICLPSGVDLDHFSPRRLSALPPHPLFKDETRPIIGFIGQIDERMDQEIVSYLAEARPDWQVALVGRIKKGVDVRALSSYKNILMAGYRDYEELPRILRHFSACIVPYKLNELTKSCSPLKVFEYLASGNPVIATPLDGLAPCANLVATAKGPQEFLSRIIEEIRRDSPEMRKRRVESMRPHSWEARTDALEACLEDALARSRKIRASKFMHLNRSAGASNELIHFPDKRLKLRLMLTAAIFCGWIFYGLRILKRLLLEERPLFVRKILITRRSRLGDALVLLPMIEALRREYPDARLVLGLQASSAIHEMMKELAPVDEVRSLDFKKLPRREKLLRTWELWREGFDVSITGGSYFHMEEALLTGAPWRIGILEGHPLDAFSNHLIRFDSSAHEARNNLRIVEALVGFPASGSSAPEWRGPACDAICSELGLDGPFILMHPGAQKESRQWPPRMFAELAKRLLEERPELHCIFTGVAAESDLVEQVKRFMPSDLRNRTRTAVGKSSITELAHLMRRAEMVVCHDTGALHLARSVGAPLLALLGPENDFRWGPYSQGPSWAVSLRYRVPCAPCGRKTCPHRYCMDQLTVQEALQAARLLLNPRKAASQGFVRQVRTCSWADLAEKEYHLPLLTIAVDARSMPPHLFERQFIRAAGAAYPEKEILVFHRKMPYLQSLAPSAHLASMQNTDLFSLCLEILEHSKGEFISIFNSNSHWHSWKVGDDVATLIRNRTANIAACAPFTNETPNYFNRTMVRDGWVTFRRSYLVDRLQQLRLHPEPWRIDIGDLCGNEMVLLRHQQMMEYCESPADRNAFTAPQPPAPAKHAKNVLPPHSHLAESSPDNIAQGPRRSDQEAATTSAPAQPVKSPSRDSGPDSRP